MTVHTVNTMLSLKWHLLKGCGQQREVYIYATARLYYDMKDIFGVRYQKPSPYSSKGIMVNAKLVVLRQTSTAVSYG